MRTLLIVLLLISLAWRTTIAYDSCNIDDYHSILILPASHKLDTLDLTGICDINRGDSAPKFNIKHTFDTSGDLSVFFPDNRTTPIRNQFNQAPYCLAFIITHLKVVPEEPTVLIWSDGGEPLLTVGTNEIKLTISGTSVSFNSTFPNAKRLQICTNGTHATYYIDCMEVKTKPFVMTSSSGIKTLSVVGKRNQTTFLFDEVFDGAIQQLYSVQCEHPLVDLRALSSIQCRSVPTECTEKKKNNLTEVLKEVCDELPKPPVEVLPFCDIVAWRNSLNISVQEIGGYDVRLINWDASKEVIRHTDGYETFMVLDKDHDVCFKQNHTTVQIRVTMPSSHFTSVGLFSEPVNLGCKSPDTPCIHFELNGNKYVNNSIVSITEVGEGENALLCKTNKRDCCMITGKRYGEFYYPNGVKVPINKHRHGFYRNRGNQVVRLNRRINEDIKSPTGVYCCVVPDACDVKQKICIELKN